MRLGGFVTHGNNVATLPRCLETLADVCDDAVAVDSGSTDGSAALAAASGIRRISHPWMGYKAARAAGAAALSGCDWVLCLDADEWMEEPARQRIRQWKEGLEHAPVNRLPRRDWAVLASGTFLYRRTSCQRLLRRDLANWGAQMGVHDALHVGRARWLNATIEHRYATSVDHRGGKERFYALLWALEAHRDGRRAKWPPLQRMALFAREAILKGALFRGGRHGAQLAWHVAAYHDEKHRWLKRLREGELPELASALARGDYATAFAGARAAVNPGSLE